jgi:RHS repeat-associated protein
MYPAYRLRLDYFGARYYSGAQGRFTSPDPIIIMKQKMVDPQQWNMYGYVRNNPLRFTDPTGMYLVQCSASDKRCNESADEFEKQRKKALTSKDDKVREAAEQWGDPGTDINVTFVTQKQMDKDAGNRDPDNYAVSAMVTPSAGSDHKGQINAEFSQDLRGSNLRQTIVHEGSQINDDFNFLKSYDPVTEKYNAAKIFTIYASESEAYDAGSRVKSYPMFPRGPKGYPKMMEYIRNQYPNADRFQFKPSEYPQ